MSKLKEIIAKIKPLDQPAIKQAQNRLDSLTKPLGSLGLLEEIAKRISGIKGELVKGIKNKVIFTLAADHGVVAEGVSAYPAEVTEQMVYNFLNGGAGINVLARHIGAKVVVADLGVKADLKIKNENLKIKKIAYGTKNMAQGPAMTQKEALQAIEAGIELVEEELAYGQIDIIAAGDMGIGNTTAASAITAVMAKTSVDKATGRGTGISDAGLENKIKVIKKAIALNRPDSDNALDVLTKIGGLEIGGLVGVILAGAAYRLPVVLDGFIVGSAGLIAFGLAPQVKDYLFAAHCSVEKGHKIILNKIGLEPLIDLRLCLGEGTAAALGINLIEAAIKLMNEMATFEQASVSKKL